MNNNFFEDIDDMNLKTEQINFKNNIRENADYKNGTEENIDFFITCAKLIKVIHFILAFIIGMAAFIVGIYIENIFVFGVFILIAIAFVITGILISKLFEWKAYVLKNIYELNNKLKQ